MTEKKKRKLSKDVMHDILVAVDFRHEKCRSRYFYIAICNT